MTMIALLHSKIYQRRVRVLTDVLAPLFVAPHFLTLGQALVISAWQWQPGREFPSKASTPLSPQRQLSQSANMMA